MQLKSDDTALSSMKRRANDVFAVAAKMFASRGFDATSMNEVADEVGLTKAGLYYYIKSKNDLLFQILIKAMDFVETGVVAPCRSVPDPEARLRTLVTLHLNSIMFHGGEYTVLFGDANKLPEAQLREVRRRQRAYYDYIREILAELREAGRLRSQDLDFPASLLMLSIEAAARWRSRDRRLDSDTVVAETVRFILAGILYDPAPDT